MAPLSTEIPVKVSLTLVIVVPAWRVDCYSSGNFKNNFKKQWNVLQPFAYIKVTVANAWKQSIIYLKIN